VKPLTPTAHAAHADVALLVTPENLAAWERALPTLGPADREPLAALLADMKARSGWLRNLAPEGLARTA